MTIETKKIEKVVTEEVTKFIAKDGTVFDGSVECEKYEASAVCAAKLRLGTILKKLDNKNCYYNGLDSLLDDWRGEADYYAFEPKTEDDIKNFIAYANLLFPDGIANNSKYARERQEPNKWYFAERFEDRKVGRKYIFFDRYGDWGVVASKERLIECIEHGFETMFDKFEEPKTEKSE